MKKIGNIAPEVNLTRVEPSADLRDAVDIDSMDFLNFITGIHYPLGIDNSEIDYPKSTTLNGAVSHFRAKLQNS